MSQAQHSGGVAARRGALDLLGRITAEGQLMGALVEGGALDRLSPPDRARAQRLALETLRNTGRADAVLAPFLARQPPAPVRMILRLGTVELCQGAAAHGVVNDLVGIVSRDARHNRLKGLVNAVLRKVAAEGPARWPDLPPDRLPDWLRAPLVAAWGAAAVVAMEAAHAAGAPLDLTARGDPAALAAALGGRVLPTGSVRLDAAGQVTALPGYGAGDWWVQDAAAALPVKILDPRPGEAVADLCAAPGGKTMQLAAAGAHVIALDRSAARLERLRRNLARAQLPAEVVVGDALTFDRGGFDAIVLDAPCSATGTIRRHPDLPYAKDGAEIGALIEQQGRMIDHALSLLRPGGRLMFCTCSLLPDEGEVQVEAALARHPGLTIDRAALDRPGIDPRWITPEGGLRLRPDYWADQGGIDGFFMALMRIAA